jgi:glycosyltransferase involved in cell wall biosynthesis
VVSSAAHFRHDGTPWSYTPYVREIDRWAELFDEVRIACPIRHEPPGPDNAPFAATNISLVALPETGGTTVAAKIRQAALVPVIVVRLLAAMRDADVVHPRCPGNVGLLALLLKPVARRPTVTKYAGQWGSYANEPWSYRVQRWCLRRPRWRDPVTVYGRAETDPPNVISFFSSAISDEELARGADVARRRQWGDTARVLFVGRLSVMKHVDAVIRGVVEVAVDGADVSLTVLGEGPERPTLDRLVDELDASSHVTLEGGVPFTEVLANYEQHDVLVLASETEGFPKVIAEAMAYGMVAVGSDVGYIREMLAGGRGVLVAPGDAVGVADALRRIVADPAAAATISERAAAWAGRYSVEALQDELRDVIRRATDGHRRRAS